MPRSPRRFFLFLALVFVIFIAVGGVAAYRYMLATRTPEPEPGPPPAPKFYSPLTGLETREELTKQRPFAVMIDNHSDARPQSGLDKAGIVYEVLAEGGITRYFAVFLDTPAHEIGPVRSARDYFLDLAMELDAIYVHCGQSPQAEVEIPKLGINDLNLEFSVPFRYSWRSNERKAPHNLYTSTDRLLAAAAEKKYRMTISGSPRELFKRVTPPTPSAGSTAPSTGSTAPPAGSPTTPASGAPAREVTITYPKAYEEYFLSWTYDQSTGTYSRFVKGQPHVDKVTEKQLTTPNIIVQYVRSEPIPKDPALRINVYFVGEGRAQLFSQGVMIEAKWTKASREAPTVFTDAQGNPLVLVPGQTWIEVVPPETKVEVK